VLGAAILASCASVGERVGDGSVVAVGAPDHADDDLGRRHGHGRPPVGPDDDAGVRPTPPFATTYSTSTSAPPPTTNSSSPAPPRPAWWVDPTSSGQPWPGARTVGLLTFRGSPTRSYHGTGPVPSRPHPRWSFPADGAMCSESYDGELLVWCGTGWTGQPAVWERDGRTLIAFGAYDRAVHVLDAATGQPVLPPFPTGDLIKGSVTVDPDGYPLLYVGSRDDRLRVLALDRPEITELWSLSAYDVSPIQWNDDWDGSPMIVGDLLVEGGENSQLHVVRLNRGYGADGRVTVAPALAAHVPAWDDQLLADVGDTNTSIEGSVAISGATAYFANSAGLVQGWDIEALLEGRGRAARTLRFWMGDDVDASVVVDGEGFLYVAAEYERSLPRAVEVGQLVKLDPRRPGAPLVWSVPLRTGGAPSGVWATPAIHGPVVIVGTNAGEVVGVDRATGAVRWTLRLTGPTWSSPVVVDDVLVQGDCGGVLRGFDVHDPLVEPRPSWSVSLGGCIESTPAVWKGGIYVGTRAGRVYGLGDG
jgi:outer membrane protein assembly factor BamB